jgi:hypothetical protein
LKKIIQIVIAAGVVASATGCASTKNYLLDRGRDAADFFTATVGVGAGAKVRIGPLESASIPENYWISFLAGQLSTYSTTTLKQGNKNRNRTKCGRIRLADPQH